METAKPSDKATVPAKGGKAAQKRKFCEYICPHCSEAVSSSVRTCQVNHRRRCGNRFRVQDARIVAKAYVYICPFCNVECLSDTKTGQIDHRSVCGNQFYVKEGRVREGRGAMPTRARCVTRLCGHPVRSGRFMSSMTRPLETKPRKKTKWHVPERKRRKNSEAGKRKP